MANLTQAQIAAAAKSLDDQGQGELANLVRSGSKVAGGICQLMGYVQAPTPTPTPALAGGSPVYTPSSSTPAAGCGCGGGNGGNGSGGSCGIVPPGTPGSSQSTTPSSQIGGWNCQTATLDLAPCIISKRQRDESLPTIEADTLSGALAAGIEIAALFVPIDVSHKICIDYILVESVAADTVATPLTISRVFLQSERIFATPEGPFVHAWTWGKPERPDYLGITDGRCACKTLCECVPAEGRVRLVFTLPTAIAADATLRVTVWANRECWQTVCGPCPPELQCDHVLLTDAEKAMTANDVYAVV